MTDQSKRTPREFIAEENGEGYLFPYSKANWGNRNMHFVKPIHVREVIPGEVTLTLDEVVGLVSAAQDTLGMYRRIYGEDPKVDAMGLNGALVNLMKELAQFDEIVKQKSNKENV